MNKRLLISLALICLLAGACAKKNTTTTGMEAQEYLQKWMEQEHPGIAPNADGLYILEDTPGTGEVRNEELPYIFSTQTIRTLSGTISTTMDEKLAQQLGTYQPVNYYGPRYQMVGGDVSYAGLDALLKGMKMGGHRVAVVPAWMLTTSRYDTQKEYLANCTNSTHLIYEITLEGQCEDIEAMSIDALRNYVTAHYGANVMPVSYVKDEDPDGSFYFLSDTTSFEGVEKFASDATVNLNYTGMLLSGKVFDTTDEIVAKNADIYDSGRDYSPQSVAYSSSYESITLGGSSIITGFKGALSLMHWKGQQAIVLFTYTHGYSTSGSGNAIPPYATLIFELEIVDD